MKTPSPAPACPSPLPDHASAADSRGIAIDRVGVKELSYPVQVMDRANGLQGTVARVNAYVRLPHHLKGTHMSRFIEVLDAVRGEVTAKTVPAILEKLQGRLEAEEAFIELSFPYFLRKRAPVSGAESLMEYQCSFQGIRRGTQTEVTLSVQVPVKSLCPCSKAISDRGAHNQRSIVTARVQTSEFIWLEELIERIEKCGSSPVFALLKREDEKFVTELAYDNPKFVEDLVRDTIGTLRELPGVRHIAVSADNHESIHNHAAYAEASWPQ